MVQLVDWCEALGWGAEQLEDLRMAGYSYLKQGHYQRAITYFEALVSLDPDSIYDNMTLGALYLQLGELERSLDHLTQALDRDPTNLSARLNRAKALLVSGRLEEGLAEARLLRRVKQQQIRDLAEALVMAYA